MNVKPASPVELSLIIPLVFVRGPTARVISSWTKRQSLARDRYEVIVVSPAQNVAGQEEVRGMLGAGDRIVEADTDNLYALYDFAIRQSRGRVVMITESHVVATRHCLARVIGHLESTRNEAVCCSALAPKNEGYLATMEAMLFEKEAIHWVSEGSWRRVHERGFAIYRETYDRLGGFPHEYGWFAGRVLAARLHSANVPVAYAEEARVVHYNSDRIADIVEGARSFTCGALAYHESDEWARANRYFGENNVLAECEKFRRSTARTTLIDRIKRLGQSSWSRRFRALPELLKLCLISLFGIHLPIFVARLRLSIARVKVMMLRPWGPAAGLDAYRVFWHIRLVRYFQLVYYRDRQPEPGDATPLQITAQEIARFASGFHLAEEYRGRLIRWSAPVVAIRLRVAGPASRFRVETEAIGPALNRRGLAFYLDGAKLPLEFEGPCCVTAYSNAPRNDACTATLVIACDPLPGGSDPRERGIPFIKVLADQPDARTAA